MKIRIIQKTGYNDGFLMPGDFADVDEEQAEKWIEEGHAIAWEQDKSKEKKAVKHGDG